jgi:hypothetical protein
MTTIVALGIVGMLFMSLMSVFYLQQLPSKTDLSQVEGDVRRDHGLYLAANEPLKLVLVPPAKKGDGIGVEVTCTLRPDIRKKVESVDLHLARICETVLLHPAMNGRVTWVYAQHHGAPDRGCRRLYDELGVQAVAAR